MGSRTACLAVAALVTLAAAAVLPARGEEAVPAAKTETPEEAVASIIKTLRANDGGIRAGMSKAAALKVTPGAATLFEDRVVPLRGSWLDPDSVRNGTFAWDTDLEEGKTVDTLRVVLLTGPFERAAMEKAIVKAGKEVGLSMENDEEDPGTWFDPLAREIDVWVAVGDGIVILESNGAL